MVPPIQESKSFRQVFAKGIGLFTSFTGFTGPRFIEGPWGQGWRTGGYRDVKVSDDVYSDKPHQVKLEADADMAKAWEDEPPNMDYDDYLEADLDME